MRNFFSNFTCRGGPSATTTTTAAARGSARAGGWLVVKQRRITSRGRSSGRGPRPERAFDRGVRGTEFFSTLVFARRRGSFSRRREVGKNPGPIDPRRAAAAPQSSARSPSPTVRRVRASKRRRPARVRAPLRPAPRSRPVVPPRVARPSAPSPLSIPRARGARPAHRSRASPSRARGIPSREGKLVAPIRGSPLDLGLARDGGRPHPLPGQGAQVQACVHRPPREKSRPRAATSRPRAAPRDARSRARARAGLLPISSVVVARAEKTGDPRRASRAYLPPLLETPSGSGPLARLAPPRSPRSLRPTPSPFSQSSSVRRSRRSSSSPTRRRTRWRSR